MCPEWLGEITRFYMAAASVHELTSPMALAEQAIGPLICYLNHWAPAVATGWQAQRVDVWTPLAQVRACDSSHVDSRLLCKALMHSLAALFDIALGNLRVRFA